MAESLRRGSIFDLIGDDEPSFQEVQKQLARAKSKATKAVKNTSSLPLQKRIAVVESEVNKVLGRYKGFVRTIRSDKEFIDYINSCCSKQMNIALDTETNNSLDPLTCQLMGLCCYIPNTKPVYVPVNHTICGTDIRLDNQVSESTIREGLQILQDNGIKVIYHNGKFDLRVLFNTVGIYPPIYWDTMIASQLLDENEPAKLKYQYTTHIDPTIGTYNIEKLFTGLPYKWINPEVFALYAATDTYDTYTVFEYQRKLFEQEGMERLYNLFLEIEMPIVGITAKMEDDGINVDLDFLNRLDEKYKKHLNKIRSEIDEQLKPYERILQTYQDKGTLTTPINYDSPQQLKVLLTVVMGRPITSTDNEALEEMGTPLSKLLLEYRHYSKLISAFTSAIPAKVSTKDGKIHASFHQMGAEDKNVRTGRFSSKEPKNKLGFITVM